MVLGGAPNVGKSSLVNAILGFPRSITAPTPGTTRDAVTALTAFDGWPVELTDTAGVRDAATGLEAQGVERARTAWAGADVCVWVLDGSQALVLPPPALACPVVPVVNKIDLPPAWSLEMLPWDESAVVRVSARTGEGIAALIERVAKCLVPHPPPPGAAVPFTEGIIAELRSAERAWAAGQVDEGQAALRALLGEREAGFA